MRNAASIHFEASFRKWTLLTVATGSIPTTKVPRRFFFYSVPLADVRDIASRKAANLERKIITLQNDI